MWGGGAETDILLVYLRGAEYFSRQCPQIRMAELRFREGKA
jgi:hypothetical protein